MTDSVNQEEKTQEEGQMNVNDLYREEIYTDRRVGLIRALVPIKATGERDETRAVIYTGEGQIMTQVGALPISFEIQAKDLAEAVAGYKAAAKVGVEKTVKQLQEMRRQEANRLVVPGQPGFNPPSGASGSGLVMP